MPGKPLIYSTTPKFLTMFGLKGLKDLPTLEDISQVDASMLPLFAQKNEEEPEIPSVPEEVPPCADDRASALISCRTDEKKITKNYC